MIMTNTALLREKIASLGISEKFIYEKLGISRFTWYKKRDGESDFKVSEIITLCEILHITSLREREQIFFAKL